MSQQFLRCVKVPNKAFASSFVLNSEKPQRKSSNYCSKPTMKMQWVVHKCLSGSVDFTLKRPPYILGRRRPPGVKCDPTMKVVITNAVFCSFIVKLKYMSVYKIKYDKMVWRRRRVRKSTQLIRFISFIFILASVTSNNHTHMVFAKVMPASFANKLSSHLYSCCIHDSALAFLISACSLQGPAWCFLQI